MERAIGLNESADFNRTRLSYVNGNGYDGLSSARSNNRGNQQFSDDEDYNYLYRSDRHLPIELEEGSDYNPNNLRNSGRLSPPKLSDSINSLSRRGKHRKSYSFDNGFGYTSTDDSNLRRSNNIPVPPISPSKLGSKMWG